MTIIVTLTSQFKALTTWTIIQSVWTLSSYLSFHPPFSCSLVTLLTYGFADMLYSLSDFSFR